jgi:hypothetical protein
VKYVVHIPNYPQGTLHCEVSKKQAFKLLRPLVTVDCFEDSGMPYGSFGGVFATQADISRQIEYKN